MNAIIEEAPVSEAAAWVPPEEMERVADAFEAEFSPMLGADLVARALDEVDFGFMVLTAQARLLFANRSALRCCGAGAPFRLERGRLRASGQVDAAAFSRSLQLAIDGRRSLLTFDVAGEAGDVASRFVAFIPMPGNGEVAGVGSALLVFGRQQVCGPLSVQFFALQHGVTLAESAVLTGLCNGHSPRRIAESRGIAVSTVRTHILRIREKTGARSIMDLLRVASMLPPLDALGI